MAVGRAKKRVGASLSLDPALYANRRAFCDRPFLHSDSGRGHCGFSRIVRAQSSGRCSEGQRSGLNVSPSCRGMARSVQRAEELETVRQARFPPPPGKIRDKLGRVAEAGRSKLNLPLSEPRGDGLPDRAVSAEIGHHGFTGVHLLQFTRITFL